MECEAIAACCLLFVLYCRRCANSLSDDTSPLQLTVRSRCTEMMLGISDAEWKRAAMMLTSLLLLLCLVLVLLFLCSRSLAERLNSLCLTAIASLLAPRE